MAEDVIDKTDEGVAADPESAPDPKELQAKIARLEAEVAEKEAQVAEKEDGMRYWHEQAKAKTAAPAVASKPAEADEDDVDPIELLSKEGARGLDKLLAKRGFVRAEEVQQRIESKAATIATENALAAEYPDLKDSNSDFFKATAAHYAPLVQAGVPQHLAMKLAAEQAELDGYKSGKRMPKAEREEREARARAQAGDKGKKTADPAEDSGELDAFQKYICEQLEVSPEAYTKRAKEGVTYTGGRK